MFDFGNNLDLILDYTPVVEWYKYVGFAYYFNSFGTYPGFRAVHPVLNPYGHLGFNIGLLYLDQTNKTNKNSTGSRKSVIPKVGAGSTGAGAGAPTPTPGPGAGAGAGAPTPGPGPIPTTGPSVSTSGSGASVMPNPAIPASLFNSTKPTSPYTFRKIDPTLIDTNAAVLPENAILAPFTGFGERPRIKLVQDGLIRTYIKFQKVLSSKQQGKKTKKVMSVLHRVKMDDLKQALFYFSLRTQVHYFTQSFDIIFDHKKYTVTLELPLEVTQFTAVGYLKYVVYHLLREYAQENNLVSLSTNQNPFVETSVNSILNNDFFCVISNLPVEGFFEQIKPNTTSTPSSVRTARFSQQVNPSWVPQGPSFSIFNDLPVNFSVALRTRDLADILDPTVVTSIVDRRGLAVTTPRNELFEFGSLVKSMPEMQNFIDLVYVNDPSSTAMSAFPSVLGTYVGATTAATPFYSDPVLIFPICIEACRTTFSIGSVPDSISAQRFHFELYQDHKKKECVYIDTEFLAAQLHYGIFSQVRKLHSKKLQYHSIIFESISNRTWDTNGYSPNHIDNPMVTLETSELSLRSIKGKSSSLIINEAGSLVFVSNYDQGRKFALKPVRLITCPILASEDEVDLNENLLNQVSDCLSKPIILHNAPNLDLIPVFEVGDGIATPSSVTFRALLNNSSNSGLNNTSLSRSLKAGPITGFEDDSDNEFGLSS